MNLAWVAEWRGPRIPNMTAFCIVIGEQAMGGLQEPVNRSFARVMGARASGSCAIEPRGRSGLWVQARDPEAL
jgi:hypothetical protein